MLSRIGARAQAVCGPDSGYGYGVLSPWHQLLEMDAKFIFWDCSIHAMTFVHHLESMVGVPHLYNKMYQFQSDQGNLTSPSVVASAVRYLNEEFHIVYNLSKFQIDATNENLLRTSKIFGIEILTCKFRGIFDFLCEKLKTDPFYLLEKTPNFIPGNIPTDVVVGALNPILRHTN